MIEHELLIVNYHIEALNGAFASLPLPALLFTVFMTELIKCTVQCLWVKIKIHKHSCGWGRVSLRLTTPDFLEIMNGNPTEENEH